MTAYDPYRSTGSGPASTSTVEPLTGRLRLYQWLLSSQYVYLRELGLRGLQAEALEVDTSPENIATLFLRLRSPGEREGAAILLWRVQTFWARRYATLTPPPETPAIAPELARGLARVADEILGAQCARLLYAETPVLRWIACVVLSVHPQTDTAVALCDLLRAQPREIQSAEVAARYAVLIEALRATRSPEALAAFASLGTLCHDFMIERLLQGVAAQEEAQAAWWYEEVFGQEESHPQVQAAAAPKILAGLEGDAAGLLTSRNKTVRALALQSTLRAATIEASDALLGVLHEFPETTITGTLLEALAARRDQRAFAFLCDWLRVSRDDEQTACLAEALRRFGERQALPCLYEAYQRVEMPLVELQNPPGDTAEARDYFREVSREIAQSRELAKRGLVAAINALRGQ